MLLALALATLLSEDLACVAAGTLVARGELGFWPASAACFAGIFAGDVLLYLAGRAFGNVALERAPLRWFVARERAELARGWLERRGALVVLLTRFVPGTRLPTYFASGALGTSAPHFLAWFALAGLLWTPLLVGLSAELGDAFAARVALLAAHGLGLALASAAVVLAGLTLVRALATRRARALLRARWRRVVRFEYWPSWVLYTPIVGYVAWLALRHRSLGVVLRANPGMHLGGLVGESKGAILRALEPSGRVPPTVTLAAGLPADERRVRARLFRLRHELALPLVLKPDVGQRGQGVVVVRSEPELEAALAAPASDLLLQAHVPGLEFGLFYLRQPDWPRGKLVSLTAKHLPIVLGDGRASVEELLLATPEHLGMLPFFLRTLGPKLAHVPAAGERYPLGDLGTHCRGALFRDAAHLWSDELELALERVSRTFPGFHLGRYDVRTPSASALMRGEFTVLELNGLTSEPTHIYDPRHSLWHAWRALARQWRRAYEIGAVNSRVGARQVAPGWRLPVDGPARSALPPS